MSAGAVLAIDDLRIGFRNAGGITEVVRGVGMSVMAGEVVALVGESGSGKSMTALGVMQLLPRGARIVSGSIRLNGSELVGLSDAQVAARRGRDMAMIFQDPLSALNPAFTSGGAAGDGGYRRAARAAECLCA
jgi:ABC-type microcin C transport system duplicated ATPase subunit YejF